MELTDFKSRGVDFHKDGVAKQKVSVLFCDSLYHFCYSGYQQHATYGIQKSRIKKLHLVDKRKSVDIILNSDKIPR